jgi:hypothetical protein
MLDLAERWREWTAGRSTDRDWSLSEFRVVVYENPYAPSQLDQELFRGRYDERYGLKEDKIQRKFAGEGIRGLEELESAI